MNPPQIELSFSDLVLDIAGASIPELSMSMQITNDEWDAVAVADAVDTSVELPATLNNSKVFGFYGVPEVQAGVVEQQKNMVLRVNGVDTLRGYGLIKGVKHSHNGFKLMTGSYSVQLFGGNATWFSKLADKYLSQYQYGAYNELQTDSNVLVGIDAKYNVLDFGYCLIKYGNLWKPKTGGGTDVPDLSEFTRFVFIKHLLDLIQEDAGIQFISNFFDSEWFKTLIIPLPALSTVGGAFAEDYINTIVKDNDAVPPANVIIYDSYLQSPIVGATWYNDTNGKFTAPYKGLYQFRYESTFTYLVPPDPTSYGQFMAIGLYKNNVFQSGSSIDAFSFNVPGSGIPPPNVTASKVFVLELNEGDIVEFRTLQFFSLCTGFATQSTVQVTGEAYFEYGAADQPSYPKYLFRNWQTKDLIKGLTQLFQLKWQSNKAGTEVYVEPADNYWYSDRETPPEYRTGFYYRDSNMDFGAKIDLSKDAATTADAFRAFSQTYTYRKDPNDEYMKGGDKDQIPMLGCRVQTQETATTDNENRENSFFAGTAQIYDKGATYTPPPAAPGTFSVVNAVQVPLMLQTSSVSEQDKFNFLPRILVFRRLSNWNDDGMLKYTTGQNMANLTNMRYPIAYVCNMQNTNGRDMSLAMGNVQVGENLVFGLVARFYAEYFGGKLLSSKTLSAYFFLNITDIQSFDFRKKVFFQNIYYKILSVDGYNPMEPESPTRLVLQPEPFDRFDIFGNIISSPLSPIVS